MTDPREVAECIARLEHRIAVETERDAVMQQYREVATEAVDWRQNRYANECADTPQAPLAFFIGVRNAAIITLAIALVVWAAVRFGGVR